MTFSPLTDCQFPNGAKRCKTVPEFGMV